MEEKVNVEQKILNEVEFLKTLKIALPAAGPEHEDELYSKGEFCDDNSITEHYRKVTAAALKKEEKRRRKSVEREQRRLGGPIKLWTFEQMKKGKKKMTDEDMHDEEAEETEAINKKAKVKKTAKTAEKSSKKKDKATMKKKDAKGKREGRSRSKRIADGKIALVEKDNPKRKGSRAHKRYELYRKHKTVAGYLKAGGKRSSLRYDEKHGYIKLSNLKTTADMKE